MGTEAKAKFIYLLLQPEFLACLIEKFLIKMPPGFVRFALRLKQRIVMLLNHEGVAVNKCSLGFKFSKVHLNAIPNSSAIPVAIEQAIHKGALFFEDHRVLVTMRGKLIIMLFEYVPDCGFDFLWGTVFDDDGGEPIG